MIHDLAQLVEDGAALDVNPEGMAERLALLEAYCQGLGFNEETSAVKAYECFAIYRAIWLATAAHASKSEHRHARLLVRHYADHSSHEDVRALAALASGAMRQLPERQQRTSPLTARQRKLSKKLARLLRHAAVEAGLDVDEGGFVSLQEAASCLQRSETDLVEVAAHPLEPRFQVDGGRIRALYGHSFPIDDAPELDVELPDSLFHGSTWSSLDAIAREGLRSMKRREVYLTNNPLEALEVARRHGRPVLLEVQTTGQETPRAAADAIWAVSSVAAAAISVVNPFTAIASPPAWLRELAEDQPSFAR
jgi:putative RNA 2'-phosphotransferase